MAAEKAAVGVDCGAVPPCGWAAVRELVVDVISAKDLVDPEALLGDSVRAQAFGGQTLLRAVFGELVLGSQRVQTRCVRSKVAGGRAVRFEGERLLFPYNGEEALKISLHNRRHNRGRLFGHPLIGEATCPILDDFKDDPGKMLELPLFRTDAATESSVSGEPHKDRPRQAGSVTLRVSLRSSDDAIEMREPVKSHPMCLRFVAAHNLAHSSSLYVQVKVLTKDGDLLARERTGLDEQLEAHHWAGWDKAVLLPKAIICNRARGRSAAPAAWSAPKRGSECLEEPPEQWPMDSIVKFSLYQASFALKVMDKKIGQAKVPLADLIKHPVKRWYLQNAQTGDPVTAPDAPYWPVELEVSLDGKSLPEQWPKPVPPEPYTAETYGKHIFIITRGTRGDVQPFTALARGMAERHGWMVTICTELRWREHVLKNANVSRGKIRFRPSGGDTEMRTNTWTARQAISSRTELMQMIMLSCSEFEFFSSTSTFAHFVKQAESEPKPVDLIVFSLTTAGIGALVGEVCNKPIAGFVLQPSVIPSADPGWHAVQAVPSHGSMVDAIESWAFTSHGTFKALKDFAENCPFATWTIASLRENFGLGPAPSTWDLHRLRNTPIVIPIRPGTFTRPSDWPQCVQMTEFIFLRNKSGGHATLKDPLASFIATAKADGAKLILVTFSSMPVARGTMLRCAMKMIDECKVADCRVIYVGKKQLDSLTRDLEDRVVAATARGQFLETPEADFGVLFKDMDAFVVHGGLGTTVEALRMRKPTCVTGPLLLDQRFWGQVIEDKRIGVRTVHLDDFEGVCADFACGALAPDDPQGWQASAEMLSLGAEGADGVEENVDSFERLLKTWDTTVSNPNSELFSITKDSDLNLSLRSIEDDLGPVVPCTKELVIDLFESNNPTVQESNASF